MRWLRPPKGGATWIRMLVYVVLLSALVACRPIQAPAAEPPTSITAPPDVPTVAAASAARQQRMWAQLWQTVADRYVYPDFNGVDWPAQRLTVANEIARGLTDDAFYALLDDVILQLGDDHSAFLSPQRVAEEQREIEGVAGYVGIGAYLGVNPDGGYAYVFDLFPGSPAAMGGLLPHDHILAVDGVAVVGPAGELRLDLIRGTAGSPVTLTVRTPGQQERDITLNRAQIDAAIPVAVGNLLPTALTGDRLIGYIMLSTFFQDDVVGVFQVIIEDLMRGGDLDGLVVDLRTNGGGFTDQMVEIAGFFTQGEIGRLKEGAAISQRFVAVAQPTGNSQTTPLVFLIGRGTESAAEMLAGMLQQQGRADLVGQPTAGNSEIIDYFEFEDGSAVWIATQVFRLPDDTGFEGVGLHPDLAVPGSDWDQFTGDDDPGLAAAVRLLTESGP